MRFGLAVLAALLLGAFAGRVLLEDSGYVLIDFGGYVIEMSVPVLLMLMAAAYLALRAVIAVWNAPRRLGQRLAERRARRAGADLTRGLMHIAEGDCARGERLLSLGARRSATPLVNYLLAARAAQSQGALERRDEWLRIAFEKLPEAAQTVLLTQAELELEAGEHARTLATLARILETHPSHPAALALASRACLALGDRARLVLLLPRLAQARIDPRLLEQAAAEALKGAAEDPETTHGRLQALRAVLPPALRRLPRVLAAYARALDRLGRGSEAERELRAALNRHWDEALVAAYGEVRGEDSARQLRQAEAWLKERPEEASLLVAAARLSIVNELWGKARSYLESALAIDPAPAYYALYGSLLDRLGENDGAALAFRSGLALLEHTSAGLPALAAPAAASEAAAGRDYS